MLAFEHTHRQQFFNQHFDFEATTANPYTGLDMNPYSSIDSAANFAALPFSYLENPSFFVEAPLDPYKYGLHRSTSSNGSLKQASQHSSELPPSLLSSASGPSIHSASSSTVGSPYSGHSHTVSNQDSWTPHQGLGLNPTIVNHEGFSNDFVGADIDPELAFATQDKFSGSFVDPSLISAPRTSYADGPVAYTDHNIYQAPSQSFHTMSPAHSPAPSPQAYSYPPNHFSPGPAYPSFPLHTDYNQRRPSITSFSNQSHQSPMSSEFDDETKEKGRCPHPECGRVFKDLKAHMLTHQSERPEKCPILHCEYNQKGFARKYDKNRHTLTHYKGTMVCGFCPGSGSAAEKSFNRADVFKRHLTSVHGVEQTPPNSRKRSPASSNKKLSSYCQDATGKCSTCSATFTNAQDFYEHLDDCVLRVVQQEEDSEAVNARRLAEVAGDEDVKDTLERHMLNPNEETITADDDDEEDDDDEDDDEEMSYNSRSGKGAIKGARAASSSRAIIGGGISKSSKPAKKGLTHSRGGVPVIGKGRKKRKHYPPSWGMSAEKMQMKKRVLCVYDGERRLWKDDLMMHNEFEVRMKLPDGKSYVTDLDVETLKRAEAFHNATEEEKGPWEQEHQQQQQFDLEALDSLMNAP